MIRPREFRLKRLMLVLGTVGSVSLQPVLAARFTDLSGNWTEKYVNALSDHGVIAAEANGKFQPDAPITRAILAAWIVKALGLQNQPVSSTPSFPDVKPTDWFYKPVEIIRQNNYIAGYADGFRPNQFLQKGEAITIIARTLNKPEPDESAIQGTLAGYKDGGNVPDWARAGITLATKAGLLATLVPADRLNASSLATRGDVAAMLYQLDQYLNQQSIAEKLQETNSPPRQQGGYYPQQGYRPPQYQQGPPMAYQQPGSDQFNATFRSNNQGSYPGQYPPGNYSGQPGYSGYAAQNSGGAPNGYGTPMLQGRVAVIEAGTHFQAKLRNSIDSGSTQPGESVEAALSEPIYSGNVPVIPAGSKVIGEITDVVSAKRFRFGANGRIDIKFTEIQTPDGRRFPLNASLDTNKISLSGGTGAGRVGKGLATAGIGAASGAVLGTALGAIVGGTAGGPVGRSTGMGAVFGTALGGGAGVIGAGVRKGSEVKITAGSSLPIQLDGALQVNAANLAPAMPQPYANQPSPNQRFNNQPYTAQPYFGNPANQNQADQNQDDQEQSQANSY